MSTNKNKKDENSGSIGVRSNLFSKSFSNPNLGGADVANTYQKNRISELIKRKFSARDYSPSDEQLNQLGLTRRMFTLILENKTEPGFGAALRIATWLDVSVDELYLV